MLDNLGWDILFSRVSGEPVHPPCPQMNISRLEEDSLIDVGSVKNFNYNEHLHNQLLTLQEKSNSISAELCHQLGKTLISDVTSDDIKSSNKIHKKHLGENILSLISQCNIVCRNINVCRISNDDTVDTFKLSESQLSEVSACVDKHLNSLFVVQNKKLAEIDQQVETLKDISNKLSSNVCNVVDDQHQHVNLYDNDHGTQSNYIDIKNPTKCVDNYVCDFITSDQANKLTEFLDNCNQFSEKNETGHSVALFGYPYHYTGSSHSDEPVDIPAPISRLIDTINENELYSEAVINSCLVNKYSGPDAELRQHSDNEHSIEPGSDIFTVSLGKEVKVKFTETHSGSPNVIEKTAQPNSLYVMSGPSQSYWSHEIEKCQHFSDTDVRYSLTFRHVSKKYLRSTVIIGDSNTQSLRFGEGKGTFGHNIPGRHVRAIHIGDIDPVDCCGYKNVFLHCGINNVKRHNVRGSNDVFSCFELLRSKIDIIQKLCPKSKIVVSPILPTKDLDLNKRAMFFNSLLFEYEKNSSTQFTTHDFNVFLDSSGKLSDYMGRFKKPSDSLHLGANGILTLVKLIRTCVYGSDKVKSNRSYTDVVKSNISDVSGVGVSPHGVVEHSPSSSATS